MIYPEAEFKEFKSRLKSAKTRFKLTAGLNLETFDTILSKTNQIKPLKFFKFGLWDYKTGVFKQTVIFYPYIFATQISNESN